MTKIGYCPCCGDTIDLNDHLPELDTATMARQNALREVLELIEKMKDQRFSEDTWYYCHAGHLKAKIEAMLGDEPFQPGDV